MKDILEHIRNNPELYQANFALIKPKERTNPGKLNTARMINIQKYQTNEVIIDRFYKSISRLIQ